MQVNSKKIQGMELTDTYTYETLIEKEIQDSFSIAFWQNKVTTQQDLLRITYNRIFLIQEGHGTIYIDDMAFPVSGNELFLLGKGQVFSFAQNTVFTGHELCFGDCFWEKTPASASNCKAVLFNNVTNNQHLPVQPSDFPGFSVLFQTLLEEFLGELYVNKPDALAAYLKIIMIKTGNLNASLNKAFDSYENQLYRQFITLVGEQYQTTHDVGDFAGQLNISTRKLSDICKRNSDKGPKDIINNQIITEAKRYLQFTSKPVKEIAFELNFATPEQFSHFFKKYTRFSPQLYRVSFVKIGM